ncbi:DUF397 domain-containing protein [Actinomadura chokoriensis]|uniref:DUF397 domain-containing protein n=1 Tax=Actinomadura chokoriensis TaxID=454156 RepID=UPI0031F8F44D
MIGGLQWRKSSRSDNQGGLCVEVAGTTVEQWRKATRSDDQDGDCIEIAEAGRVCEAHRPVVAVRDSTDPDGPMLVFGPADWRRLSSRIKSGAFDLE